LDKNNNIELSTTEGFWEGNFRLNDICERNNNNNVIRNWKISGEIDNKKRKIEDEERVGKTWKLRYNDDNITGKYNPVSYFEVNICERTLLSEKSGLENVAKAEGEGVTGGSNNKNNKNNNNDNNKEYIQGDCEDDGVLVIEVNVGSDEGRNETGEDIQDAGVEEELERFDVGNDDDNKENNQGNYDVDEEIEMGLDGGSDEERNEDEEDNSHEGRDSGEEDELQRLDEGSSTEASDGSPLTLINK
jgi:hypothetical protein